MQIRTDTDLLAFYGVDKPPVGSVWTWHTRDGHQITAVATHSPTDRLGRAGGIPAVDARRLVNHPANVGILAAIFREHVCATAYTVLVFDPAGEAGPRWAVCDGNGRTSAPALTEFGAWRLALADNASGEFEGGPWVKFDRAPDDLRASLKAARVGRGEWKAEAERQRERADIAVSGLKAAGRLLGLGDAADAEALGSTAATVAQRACSTHGVETISELSAQLLKANAAAELQKATFEHLRAHYRGLDPQVMALAWEHDPALAEDLTHPIFRVLPAYLDERHATHDAAALFAYTSPATNVADGVVVALNDDGSLWATLDTPTHLRATEHEIIELLIDGLALHRGVQALLGVDDAETARGFIRVETTVPF